MQSPDEYAAALAAYEILNGVKPSHLMTKFPYSAAAHPTVETRGDEVEIIVKTATQQPKKGTKHAKGTKEKVKGGGEPVGKIFIYT